ncbi:MAG: hypothetical protein WKF30_10500 [Pyrinomonadaceae bacterium]
MQQITNKTNRLFCEESVAFVLTLFFCLTLCVLFNYCLPAQKRGIDYVAQSILSALLAVPTGAAWRSLKRAQVRNS